MLTFHFVLLEGGGNFYKWAQKEAFWDKHLKGIAYRDDFPFSLAADHELSARCSHHNDRPHAKLQGQSTMDWSFPTKKNPILFSFILRVPQVFVIGMES